MYHLKVDDKFQLFYPGIEIKNVIDYAIGKNINIEYLGDEFNFETMVRIKEEKYLNFITLILNIFKTNLISYYKRERQDILDILNVKGPDCFQ